MASESMALLYCLLYYIHKYLLEYLIISSGEISARKFLGQKVTSFKRLMTHIVTYFPKSLQQLTFTGFSNALFSPSPASNSIGNYIFSFIYSYSFKRVALNFFNMLNLFLFNFFFKLNS